jgi:hypothetical protein
MIVAHIECHDEGRCYDSSLGVGSKGIVSASGSRVVSTSDGLVVLVVGVGCPNSGASVGNIMARADIMSRGSETTEDRDGADFGVAEALIACLAALPELCAGALDVAVE